MATLALLDAGPATEMRRPRLDHLRSAVEHRLRALAPPARRENGLTEAVRHALLAPGKRIRPLLVLLAFDEFGGSDLRALDAACALEMVHAASLVLDDLPAMDNAETRRGRPSTHVRFGEDVAILASVSLLGLAFGTVAASATLDAATRASITGILSAAIGTEGLAGGQYADLTVGVPTRALDQVLHANGRKTGALFVAAFEIAAAAARLPDGAGSRLVPVAEHLGQAFQILDDLQDGPSQGCPGEDAGRANLVALLGRDEARRRLEDHLEMATDALRPDGELRGFVAAIFAGGRGRDALAAGS